MPGIAVAGVPSLSQIVGWDSAHLSLAAADWASTAEHWEHAFDGLHRGMLSPGGSTWEGAAADAARARSFGDVVAVRRLADVLREAATVARHGAVELDYRKRRAIEAINDARAAGFTVSDDLSVNDSTTHSRLRADVARLHALMIAARAVGLTAADREIAYRINTVTSNLDGREFVESPPDDDMHVLDVPLAPPPDPAYPMNDVIADATDLDGNHVVLRRGYYTAATDRGFGWDKIYWKHGMINTNVFNDLISHSRPIDNQGGTLVYEVPINKTHCTSGFLGLPSCTDTGESLTMKIVVNTNPSFDIPDGGQKGVITMFPLPGGSGVVEVKPNWTLTPPWVNNYVPIN